MLGHGIGPSVAPLEEGALTRLQAENILSIYLEARNRPNLELLDSIYHPEVVVHDCGEPEDLRGLPALKGFYRANHEGLPDLHMEIGDWLYAGDRLVSRWTVTGTHLGELRGLPPTGRAMRVSGVAIDRVVADRIVEEWVDYNLLAVLQQLGVAPG